MAGAWHFTELVPGHKIREATQDEFFAADAIRGAADALVREGIQNSLDAGDDASPVKVVISLGTVTGPERTGLLQELMNSGWGHFNAPDNGLTDTPRANDACRYLVFEDFGTSGLTGDPRQLLPIADIENRFFHFFRVEGRSDKHEDDRGRWGVGKQVFPRASRIKSVLGFTIRSDDRKPLLMGQTILRSHDCDGSGRYYQDGWFGERAPGSEPVYPVNDVGTIAKFCKTFAVTRRAEPGLSLAVPYLQDDITEEAIVAAVLRGYFYPILIGMLEVTVRGNAQFELSARNIAASVDQLPSELRDEIRPVLNLAIWGKNNRDPLPELVSPDPEGAPQWNESLIPHEIRTLVRENLRSRRPFGLRVPLSVRPRLRGKAQRPSYFDTYIVQDDKEASGRPIFIREGIIVSDVRGHRSRGTRSLVVIDRGALATMLGDSENPAHTQWQRDGSKFKDRYYYGPAYIRFVSDAVAEIVRLSTQTEDQEDLSLLSDIFSLPAEDGEEGVEDEQDSTRPDKDKRVEQPVFPEYEPRLRFVVSPVDGGFTVTPKGAFESLPANVRVRAAYDVRRGNAFSKYNIADFRLDRMKVQPSGCEITRCAENEIVLRAIENGFTLTVRGFDPKRDVRVSVTRAGGDQ